MKQLLATVLMVSCFSVNALTPQSLEEHAKTLISEQKEFQFLNPTLELGSVGFNSPIRTVFEKGVCKIRINENKNAIGYRVIGDYLKQMKASNQKMLLKSIVAHELAHCYRQLVTLMYLSTLEKTPHWWKIYEYQKDFKTQESKEELFADVFAIYHYEKKSNTNSEVLRNFYTFLRKSSGDLLSEHYTVDYAKDLKGCPQEVSAFSCAEKELFENKKFR